MLSMSSTADARDGDGSGRNDMKRLDPGGGGLEQIHKRVITCIRTCLGEWTIGTSLNFRTLPLLIWNQPNQEVSQVKVGEL